MTLSFYQFKKKYGLSLISHLQFYQTWHPRLCCLVENIFINLNICVL